MKRLLLILGVFLTSTTIYAQNSQTYLLGDVNRDGKVTVADAMMVVNIILNGYTSFSVNPTAVTMFADGSATIDIEGGYNEYEVTSSNTDIVTSTLSGSTITLTAVASGETKVIVKDVLTMRYVEIPVKVGYPSSPSYSACPDEHHPHLIDLDLPSGTKWACCNVDTDHPEKQTPTNYGGYYAWGETETKTTYNWSTYTHCDGSSSTCHDLGDDIAGTEYDVAHVKWGGSWVMPSRKQQDELRDNCTYEWTTVNGVNGGKFTSKKNGGSIFLPAAGYRYDSGLLNAGYRGKFWSSTQGLSSAYGAYGPSFDSGGTYSIDSSRYSGQTVRPVVSK